MQQQAGSHRLTDPQWGGLQQLPPIATPRFPPPTKKKTPTHADSFLARERVDACRLHASSMQQQLLLLPMLLQRATAPAAAAAAAVAVAARAAVMPHRPTASSAAGEPQRACRPTVWKSDFFLFAFRATRPQKVFDGRAKYISQDNRRACDGTAFRGRRLRSPIKRPACASLAVSLGSAAERLRRGPARKHGGPPPAGPPLSVLLHLPLGALTLADRYAGSGGSAQLQEDSAKGKLQREDNALNSAKDSQQTSASWALQQTVDTPQLPRADRPRQRKASVFFSYAGEKAHLLVACEVSRA
ncbi:hypothetical protein Efla_003387 [Eimeria flavescens]